MKQVTIKSDSLTCEGLKNAIRNTRQDDILYFEGEGLISNNPKTWSIIMLNDNRDIIDCFLYQSYLEYKNDLKFIE